MIFNRNLILNTLKICISLVLITYILLKIDIGNAISTIKTIDIYFFLMAILMQIINIPIRAYKWKLLLSVQGIQAPLKTLVSISLIGTFFNNFLPTSMGGDVVRAYEISKLTKQKVKSVSTIVLQRFTGLIAIIFFGVIGVIIGSDMEFIKNISGIIGIFTLAFIVLLAGIYSIEYFKKLNIIKSIFRFNIIEQIYDSINVYKFRKKESIIILFISLIAEFIVIIYFYSISLSLHQEISIIYFFILIPIISIIEMLPISINGIGVREGAFLYFFTKIGVLDYIAVSMSLVYYIQKVGVSLTGGLIYALRRSEKEYVS